mgnify:CR=1 FL=1
MRSRWRGPSERIGTQERPARAPSAGARGRVGSACGVGGGLGAVSAGRRSTGKPPSMRFMVIPKG